MCRAVLAALDGLERPVEEGGQQRNHDRTGNDLVVAALGDAIEEERAQSAGAKRARRP